MPRRKGAETRAALITASLAAFSEHGYSNTTLEQIGERLGITRPAVLHHFGSKKDLAGAILAPLLDDMNAVLGGHERHAPLRSADAVQALLRDTVDTFSRHGLVLQVTTDPSTEFTADVISRVADLKSRWIDLAAGPSPSTELRYRCGVAEGALIRAFHTSYQALAADLTDERRRDIIFTSVWAALTAGNDRFDAFLAPSNLTAEEGQALTAPLSAAAV